MDDADKAAKLVSEKLPMHGVTVVVTRYAVEDADPPTLEQVVDGDLIAFEEFFRGLGNEKLSGPERAAIKTYLWWKTHPEDPRVTNTPVQDPLRSV